MDLPSVDDVFRESGGEQLSGKVEDLTNGVREQLLKGHNNSQKALGTLRARYQDEITREESKQAVIEEHMAQLNEQISVLKYGNMGIMKEISGLQLDNAFMRKAMLALRPRVALAVQFINESVHIAMKQQFASESLMVASADDPLKNDRTSGTAAPEGPATTAAPATETTTIAPTEPPPSTTVSLGEVASSTDAPAVGVAAVASSQGAPATEFAATAAHAVKRRVATLPHRASLLQTESSVSSRGASEWSFRDIFGSSGSHLSNNPVQSMKTEADKLADTRAQELVRRLSERLADVRAAEQEGEAQLKATMQQRINDAANRTAVMQREGETLEKAQKTEIWQQHNLTSFRESWKQTNEGLMERLLGVRDFFAKVSSALSEALNSIGVSPIATVQKDDAVSTPQQGTQLLQLGNEVVAHENGTSSEGGGLPDVSSAMTEADLTLQEFTAQAALVKQRLAEEEAAARQNISYLRSELEGKLKSLAATNKEIESANSFVKMRIDNVRQSITGSGRDIKTLQRRIETFKDVFINLMPKFRAVDRFVQESAAATSAEALNLAVPLSDNSGAASGESVPTTTAAPTAAPTVAQAVTSVTTSAGEAVTEAPTTGSETATVVPDTTTVPSSNVATEGAQPPTSPSDSSGGGDGTGDGEPVPGATSSPAATVPEGSTTPAQGSEPASAGVSTTASTPGASPVTGAATDAVVSSSPIETTEQPTSVPSATAEGTTQAAATEATEPPQTTTTTFAPVVTSVTPAPAPAPAVQPTTVRDPTTPAPTRQVATSGTMVQRKSPTSAPTVLPDIVLGLLQLRNDSVGNNIMGNDSVGEGSSTNASTEINRHGAGDGSTIITVDTAQTPEELVQAFQVRVEEMTTAKIKANNALRERFNEIATASRRTRDSLFREQQRLNQTKVQEDTTLADIVNSMQRLVAVDEDLYNRLRGVEEFSTKLRDALDGALKHLRAQKEAGGANPTQNATGLPDEG